MREFRDSIGATWQVYPVHPSLPKSLQGAEPIHIAPQLVNGWLCFQSGEHRRRIAPIPAGWEELDELELGLLCVLAPEVPRRPRPKDDEE
jgi:hypothetical protein